MIKIGIVGGTGYTGVELLRSLASHPQAELAAITSRKEAGTFSLGNATDKSTVRTSNGPVEIAVGSTAAENAARPQH